MKAAISAEVARKELADDIKRGPGGIREIEFLVQALQLIRGGREPALRERRLLPALQALVEARPGQRRGRRDAGRGLSLPAPAREPPADAARRADARVAANDRRPRAHRRARSATPTGTRCARRSMCSARASPPNSKRCSRRADARSAPDALTDVLARAARWRRQRRRWPTPASSKPATPTRRCATSPAARACAACPTRARAPGPRAAGAAAGGRAHRSEPMLALRRLLRAAAQRAAAQRATSPCSTSSRRRWRGWSKSVSAQRAAGRTPGGVSAAARRTARRARRRRRCPVATRCTPRARGRARATTTPRRCCRRSTKCARR